MSSSDDVSVRFCIGCSKPRRMREKALYCNHCHGYNQSKLNTNTARAMPKRPTNAAPGSKAKIEIMRKRYERGEHLYHPLDNRTCNRHANGNTRGVDLLNEMLGIEYKEA